MWLMAATVRGDLVLVGVVEHRLWVGLCRLDHVQQRMTVAEAASMPFYHPVIEEALQEGLEELGRLFDANVAFRGGPAMRATQSTAA